MDQVNFDINHLAKNNEITGEPLVYTDIYYSDIYILIHILLMYICSFYISYTNKHLLYIYPMLWF